MNPSTPIDEFCQGRLALPELLTQIERTFAAGDRSEQSALLDSWRKNDLKNALDQEVSQLIEEKIETEHSKSQLQQGGDERTVMLPKPVVLRQGSVLKGRFILEEMLGSGGMGVVFRAIDLRKREAQDRDPSIAIKVLNEDFRKHPDSFRALQREARKAQTLAHPNIITVYDFDREGSLIYLTMEYLSGSSLEKKLKAKSAPMPMDQVTSIVKSVGAALAFAHENGIVHSDLKPANIFITDSGRVKVIDFGIARAIKRSDQKDSGETTVFDAGQLRALTPAYASVEMIEGLEPDARDDIYALGCITYELVAGRHPFGRMMATQALAAELAPKKPEQLTAKQWRALSRALSLDRKHRTPSVGEFTEEFLSVPTKPRFALSPLHIGAAVGLGLLCLGAVYLVVANPFRSGASVASKELTVSQDPEEVARREAERRAAAAAELAKKQEAERVAAEAAAKKKEEDRLAAEAAAKKEAERLAAEAAQKETDRLAAEAAAKREADRLAAEAAAKKETDRLAAEAAAKKEADRLAAEAAAKKETERLAAEAAAKKEAERLAAEAAAKKEAERLAAEAAAKKDTDRLAADAAAKKEADRVAAETARKEAQRQAAEAAAKKEADRKAAEAAKKEANQRANAAPSASDSGSSRQVATLNVPRLTDAALVGAWCAGSVKIRLSPTEWRFQLPDGSETKLAVTQWRVAGDKIVVYSTDNRDRETVTEFGNFSTDQMTQIRGRLLGADGWNSYNRVFKRC